MSIFMMIYIAKCCCFVAGAFIWMGNLLVQAEFLSLYSRLLKAEGAD